VGADGGRGKNREISPLQPDFWEKIRKRKSINIKNEEPF
jgi:hypothetical protein